MLFQTNVTTRRLQKDVENENNKLISYIRCLHLPSLVKVYKRKVNYLKAKDS